MLFYGASSVNYFLDMNGQHFRVDQPASDNKKTLIATNSRNKAINPKSFHEVLAKANCRGLAMVSQSDARSQQNCDAQAATNGPECIESLPLIRPAKVVRSKESGSCPLSIG